MPFFAAIDEQAINWTPFNQEQGFLEVINSNNLQASQKKWKQKGKKSKKRRKEIKSNQEMMMINHEQVVLDKENENNNNKFNHYYWAHLNRPWKDDYLIDDHDDEGKRSSLMIKVKHSKISLGKLLFNHVKKIKCKSKNLLSIMRQATRCSPNEQNKINFAN